MSELIFGKYEVIRRIAIGGMGEIFLARQTGVAGFERLVILKNLLPELAKRPGFVDQFLDEARVAATLNHPNIVGIFEVGSWKGVYYLAMEYIRGDSLAGLIMTSVQRGLVVPLPVVARVVHDAALGLEHAHRATSAAGEHLHIVHRDISPHNIMVRDDGVTKVVDFGIARASNRMTRTSTGTIKGKLAYMAPEQIEDQPLDARADQFALGIVLWEFCAQRRLFPGDDAVAMYEAITTDSMPALVHSVDPVPAQLQAIASRMLARDREQRFDSCADVADALRRYMNEHAGEAELKDVAVIVEQVVGDELQERTRDLTPEKSDFLIRFHGDGEGDESLDRRTATVDVAPSAIAPSAIAPSDAGPDRGHDHPGPTASRARKLGLGISAGVALILGLAFAHPDVRSAAFGSSDHGQPPAGSLPTDPGVDPEPPAEPPAPPQTPGPQNVAPDVPEETTQRAAQRERGRDSKSKRRKGGRKNPRGPPSPEPLDSAPVPAPAAPDGPTFGSLTVRTRPWTKASIDGEPHGATPFKVKLTAGPHTLRFVNEQAGIDRQERVTIRPDQTTKLDLDLTQ